MDVPLFHEVVTEPPPALMQAIRLASVKHSVPIELLVGMAWVESRYNHTKVNPVSRAAGTFQMLPDTARALGIGNPHDDAQAADGAARFLHRYFMAHKGQWKQALACYVWGPGKVRAMPLSQLWPKSVKEYVENVRRAGDAAPIPFAGDILVVSRSSKWRGSRWGSGVLGALQRGDGFERA